ncbi:MAG: class I SAM-dependent methyltransferase [Stackebrandtia sp.]
MPPLPPEGTITRGVTGPNRLRRLDRWLNRRAGSLLRGARVSPLAADLGFGADTVTTREWRSRLARVRPDVRVTGVEIDPERVAAAAPRTIPGRLEFVRGGFELAGLSPHLVRAMNVLRQYDETEVADAWRRLCRGLAPGGLLVEGTCDETGRVATWVLLDSRGPISLTLAASLSHLERPAVLAERLPKALIHRNVPGEPVFDLMTALDEAWRDNAAARVFGPRDRWRRSLDARAAQGWPIAETPPRRRDGTLTVPWERVAPVRREGPVAGRPSREVR